MTTSPRPSFVLLQLFIVVVVCHHLVVVLAASSSGDGRRWLPGRRYQVTEDDYWPTPSEDGEESTKSQYPIRIISGRDFDLFDSTASSKKDIDQESESQEPLAGQQQSAAAQDLSQGPVSQRNAINSSDQNNLSTQHDDKLRTIRQASVTTNKDDDDDDDNKDKDKDNNRGDSFRFYSRNPTTRTPKFSEYGRSSSSSSGLFLIPPPVAEWWTANITPNIKNLPKLQCRIEPTTTLKIRKTFRPLKTIVQLGADFNTQLGVWQFKSSWEDAIIGGKLTLAGRELQLTKSWQLSVGAVEDLVTRLRLRAAVDLSTYKAYVRVGFRTERLAPINVMEGFTLMKQVPLDGNAGHVKLEVKANVALPEPELEYSTESQRSLIGMGNIEVSIEELNLVLDY